MWAGDHAPRFLHPRNIPHDSGGEGEAVAASERPAIESSERCDEQGSSAPKHFWHVEAAGGREIPDPDVASLEGERLTLAEDARCTSVVGHHDGTPACGDCHPTEELHAARPRFVSNG